MDSVITVLEIIGTVAFAISGALTAIRKNMDLLGITILGVTTAVGGGIIRDLILGITPPKTFQDPYYAVISAVVSCVVFLLFAAFRKKQNMELSDVFEKSLIIFDSVGLGAFTVVGISAALCVSDSYNMFLLCFVGVVTGVGGGVLRDILANDIPYIFVKHIYACAAIAGAVVCVLLWDVTGDTVSMITGMAVVIVIRLLAAKFKWNLPKLPKDI